MAGDINKRINQLRGRRIGADRLTLLDETARREVLAKSLYGAESWEKRAANQPNTRYIAGAMAEVDAQYTRISVETAERVGKQLRTGLANAGLAVDFRLQGSVPLNVHIRGVSDVDLLVLDGDFFTYHTSGALGQLGHYVPSAKNSLTVLSTLRQRAETVLKGAYPAAKVDTSGAKAINISGGSLPRVVDVVPSHWYNTIAYQSSHMEHDRAVTILNKKVPETINNLPFLHIKEISGRCDAVNGSLRKAIRLCKNVKADAESDGTDIPLPSFDIAATMYHASQAALRIGAIFDLAILAETQRHLDALARDHDHAKTLFVPDGSRRIFDTPEKLRGLNRLSIEMDDLMRAVAKEQNAALAIYKDPSLDECRQTLAYASL
ncbi:MAG: hypothetical protein K8R10_02985 [Rhodocyclales bacterium]|nr:hypothetical protein [Rhodocyclales bacterium]